MRYDICSACRRGGVPARVREAAGDAGEGAQARPHDEAAGANHGARKAEGKSLKYELELDWEFWMHR